MTFENDLMRVNNGLNTTLHGVRTAKMVTEGSTLPLLGLGAVLYFLFKR